MQGWIKLHRKLLKNPIFNKAELLQLFIYCLLKANYEDNEMIFNSKLTTIKKGSFITGRKVLANSLSQNPRTTYDRLKLLESLEYIRLKSNNKFSLITVVNYESYQLVKQQTNNKPTTNQQQTNTDKNKKKKKNKTSSSLDKNINIKNDDDDDFLKILSEWGVTNIENKIEKLSHTEIKLLIELVKNKNPKNPGAYFRILLPNVKNLLQQAPGIKKINAVAASRLMDKIIASGNFQLKEKLCEILKNDDVEEFNHLLSEVR